MGKLKHMSVLFAINPLALGETLNITSLLCIRGREITIVLSVIKISLTIVVLNVMWKLYMRDPNHMYV